MAENSDPSMTENAVRLALRRVAIDTYRENVAYLHRECSVVRAEGFQALAKIEVGQERRTARPATLNVVDDDRLVGGGRGRALHRSLCQLGLPEGRW